MKHESIYNHLNKELVPNAKLKWENELEIHLQLATTIEIKTILMEIKNIMQVGK